MEKGVNVGVQYSLLVSLSFYSASLAEGMGRNINICQNCLTLSFFYLVGVWCEQRGREMEHVSIKLGSFTSSRTEQGSHGSKLIGAPNMV